MTPIQWLSVLAYVLLLIYSIKRIRLNPNMKLLKLPAILLAVHGILFYTYVFLNHLGFFPVGSFFDVLRSGDWSAIFRAHSAITFLSLEIYSYYRSEDWTSNNKRQIKILEMLKIKRGNNGK